MYFLFSSDEDGEHRAQAFETQEDIEALLNLWLQYGAIDEPLHFLESLGPEHHDMDYWGESYLLIKGEIVVPVAKETVTRYKV